jgi:hypothetical protein
VTVHFQTAILALAGGRPADAAPDAIGPRPSAAVAAEGGAA